MSHARVPHIDFEIKKFTPDSQAPSGHRPRNKGVRIAVKAVRDAEYDPDVIEGKAYRVFRLDDDRRQHGAVVSRTPSGSSQERLVLAHVRRALRASLKARAR
jgi:hypothetical protein